MNTPPICEKSVPFATLVGKLPVVNVNTYGDASMVPFFDRSVASTVTVYIVIAARLLSTLKEKSREPSVREKFPPMPGSMLNDVRTVPVSIGTAQETTIRLFNNTLVLPFVGYVDEMRKGTVEKEELNRCGR